jgi:hypothetical protein
MTTNDPADSAARLVAWTPLRNLTDFVRVTTDSWRLAAENNTLLKRLETAMADVSGLLNEVADGLRGPLATSITELVAERDRLASENASLKGEDVAESTAAQAVKAAFDEVAAKFSQAPEVPDVDPLPEPTPEPAPGEVTPG